MSGGANSIPPRNATLNAWLSGSASYTTGSGTTQVDESYIYLPIGPIFGLKAQFVVLSITIAQLSAGSSKTVTFSEAFDLILTANANSMAPTATTPGLAITALSETAVTVKNAGTGSQTGAVTMTVFGVRLR